MHNLNLVIKMKLRLLLLTFLFSALSWGQSVIISQYIETNSGSTPKGIEVYNVSGTDIVFSAGNNLQVYQGTNGGACSAIAATNITSGTLRADEVWVIGTSNLTSFAITNGVNLSGTTDYAFTFNGDDALQIRLGGVLQDQFGNCGSDPGSAWSGGGVSTADLNLQVLDGLCTGDTDGWADPSERFTQIADGTDMTGFGNSPASCGISPSGNLITVTQATGGTITPGTTSVPDGNNQDFTATADACYTFTNWVVDGVNAGSSNPYSFTNVLADHTITAVYTQNTYSITATAGANGSISPSGTSVVNCGDDLSYTFTPDSGYAVQDVLVDGVSVGAVTSYDFINVTGNHTISVSFMVYVGPCLSADFESGNPAGWLINGTVLGGQNCGGSQGLVFNGSGDNVVTTAITNPQTLTFNKRRSSNTTLVFRCRSKYK